VLTEDQIVGLLKAWDDMDAAGARVEVALPEQMTAAILAFRAQRLQFRSRLQTIMQHAHKTAAPKQEG
jgi:hypothetical protein